MAEPLDAGDHDVPPELTELYQLHELADLTDEERAQLARLRAATVARP